MDFLSIAIGFIATTATGAAGTYYGNKYTDERKKISVFRESRESFFRKIKLTIC
jgi:hypothetical protein